MNADSKTIEKILKYLAEKKNIDKEEREYVARLINISLLIKDVAQPPCMYIIQFCICLQIKYVFVFLCFYCQWV